MKVDLSKVTEIIIKDYNGNVIDSFNLGMASLVTMHDKTKRLELSKAPLIKNLDKWSHKNGDIVIAFDHKSSRTIKGEVSLMNESRCFVKSENDEFWCFNANIQGIINK